MADFETTTTAGDCRVWGWGGHKIGSTQSVIFGDTIADFVDSISEGSAVCYFHNLRFDGTFILDYLFRIGFKLTNEDEPMKGEFSTLISRMGKFFSITVKWLNGKRTEFRDSLKKIPLSVEGIARAYKLDMIKGDIDYHVHRPVGHVLTDEEKSYIERDVLIVSQAMERVLIEGMTKLTVGSDSLAEYKRLMGSKAFKNMFPVLPLDVDTEIRKAYRGGFTYADPRHRGEVTRGGKAYDVNSLYPSVMYEDVLPRGRPVFKDEPPGYNSNYPLFIAAMTITAKVKPGHIPCIQIKNSKHFLATDYVKEIPEPTTVYATNIDLEVWREQYDITVHEWSGTWYFRGVRDAFKAYIDKWMKVKEESEGGRREIAKLHLNSLYGKFATNPNVTGKIPVFEDDRVKLRVGEEDQREPVYTPMGVFITSYARAKMVRAAQANYSTFAYCDTDSLHLLTDDHPDNLDIDPHKMGLWKHEYDFTAGKFIRAKAYSELKPDGTYKTHVAGLPVEEAQKLTFDELQEGNTLGVKLVPKTVPGGIVLKEQTYTLTV